MENEKTENEPIIRDAEDENGRFPLTLHVVFLLCGSSIWYLYWIYHMTKYLNARIAFGHNPRNTLLLSIFVPFYTVYWTYKAAQGIDLLGKTYQKQEISILCLIFQLFVPIVISPFFFPILSPILMQNKLNGILDAEKAPTSQDTTADDLKKYKALLDEGAITQEEYDTIKARFFNKFKNE